MSEIRTAEELAALPDRAVLTDGSALAYATEWLSLLNENSMALSGRPLTLLYRPDWPSQPDLRAAVDAALALHVPEDRGLGPHCSCGLGVLLIPYPCATVRALAPVVDPGPHTTSDEEK